MVYTTSPESRDRLRQAIIDEINSLEASARALKSHHNEFAPISRLPYEVLSAIFSLLSVFAWNEGSGLLTWIYVAHVCRRWRETALNHPRFWSYINLTKLTSVGMAEILSRAKTVPLHLEADLTKWDGAPFEVVERQLEAHISHTRHLKFSGSTTHIKIMVERLASPTPTLESLSLSHKSSRYGFSLPYVTIPDNLFNRTTPNLTSLKLEKCNISWKSPLLKGLRTLEILDLPARARPELNDWLDALNELPQLKELFVQSATPLASLSHPLISRTVTLPSLTNFRIDAYARDCALALEHLVLPTLTRLHVDIGSHDRGGGDVLLVIPYVVQNVYALQDTGPIRSILIAGERKRTEVLTWTTPGVDVKVCDLDTLDDMSRSACLHFAAKFAAKGDSWHIGVKNAIFDALLTLLPMNSISTLTAQNCTRLSKESWLKYASRLPLLEQARLVPTAVKAFTEMLAEDIPVDSDGPRLPMLTKLILLDVTFTTIRTFYLRNQLIERVEQGIPLEHLDLRTCRAPNSAIQLLTEIVVDVQEPPDVLPEDHFGLHRGAGYYKEVGFDDGQISWYDVTDDDDSEDEYGEEDSDEDSDEVEDEMDYYDSDEDLIDFDRERPRWL